MYMDFLNSSNGKDIHIIFSYNNWDDYSYKSTFNVLGWSNHKFVYLSDCFKFMKVEKNASYSNILNEMQTDNILNHEFIYGRQSRKPMNSFMG